jgi:hypothetical protein
VCLGRFLVVPSSVWYSSASPALLLDPLTVKIEAPWTSQTLQNITHHHSIISHITTASYITGTESSKLGLIVNVETLITILTSQPLLTFTFGITVTCTIMVSGVPRNFFGEGFNKFS